MISCTSGQIRWVYQYLLSEDNAQSFKEAYKKELNNNRPTGNKDIDFLTLAAFGYPKVFRPAYEKWANDIIINAVSTLSLLPLQFIKAVVTNSDSPMILDKLTSLTTSRILTSLTNKDLLDKIALEFNRSKKIGISFNSYDPKSGTEYVYLNDAARNFLREEGFKDYYIDSNHHPTRTYRVYKDINGDAIRDALWLYAYGFSTKTTDQLDGAFFRDIMLAELSRCDIIFSVRPISRKWIGNLPRSYQENEDLKTEVSFNGAYAAERDQIIFINKLLKENVIDKSTKKGSKYKEINLIEIEPTTQRGYYDYALESEDVFEKAQETTLDEIKKSNLKF